MASHNRQRIITENTPLTIAEQKFLNNYIKTGNLAEAVAQTPELHPEGKRRDSLSRKGTELMKLPHIQAEYARIVEVLKDETLATANEVMEYFTKVMRGEEKDQFGLDAPLSERTKAAQELAKRLIDLEARKQGTPDNVIAVKLDWDRD